MNQEVKHAHVARIHVDTQPYESPSPTTGAALYLLAHVQAGLQLFSRGHDDGIDSLIPDDATSVELKTGDHFRTGKPGHDGITIYVNTDPFVWGRPRISYDELVRLAFPDGPLEGNVRYSITWTMPDGSEGAVLKGGKVKVVEGMNFDVRNTDKS